MRIAEPAREPGAGSCPDCGATLEETEAAFCSSCGAPRNSSGRGRESVVPSEVKRWNWGAFLLSWIWGLGNRVFVSLWALVIGPIMAVILGVKGSEWAWRKKRWASVEAFRRTQRRWALAGVAYVALAVTIVVLALSLGATDDARIARTLVSDDASLEIRVPETWEELDLNDVASLEAGDELAERYAIVIEDHKADFAEPPSLEELTTEVHRAFVRDLDAARVTGGPDRMSVGGERAIRYEIRGKVDDLNVIYLQTFVETDRRYLQILAWTLPSEYPEARHVLERVIRSVRET